MEGEGRVFGGNGSSYWMDGCEDISCDLINNFVDFYDPLVQDSVENTSSQDFFGGIDQIFDSIKNGGGLPPLVGNSNGSVVNGNGNRIHDSVVGDGLCPSELDNGIHRDYERSSDSRDRGLDSEERCGKRSRTNGCKNDRQYYTRGQKYPKDRERCSARKRVRDWDDIDRRDREHVRRREHYYSGNRRDGRDREPRVYWERDQSGSNEMVFRLGSSKADKQREVKAASEKMQECNGKMKMKFEQPKEMVLEVHARQYQLDVLEHAKRKNTIAFLETCAGKTLIVVLLIKSIVDDLQKHNRKLLSVFLVPKVPLVY
ncbi:hypothetical protein V6N13_032135 [Hibiscus sabdariffa]|uniref:Uncharacterized protein n=1 Tax=Hibiscus sabdariffa TaxID=183260 RepID=A0ABR2BDB7_9ROSI